MNKDKIFLYCDRLILTFLCLVIFCLPFSKAGIESFVWPAIFIFILKKFLGFREVPPHKISHLADLNKALGVYIVINAVSVIFSTHHTLSFRGFFGKELKFLAIYFMATEVINSRRRLKVILSAIIASASFIILDASIMYFKGAEFLRQNITDINKFCASFQSASGFASWLNMIIFIFFGIVAIKTFRNKILRYFLPLAIIIQFLFLIKADSRGAWFGFATGFSLVVFYLLKNSSSFIRRIAVFLPVFLILTGLIVPKPIVTEIKYYIWSKFYFTRSLNTRLKTITDSSYGTSTYVRENLWNEAAKIILNYPLTGCGLNTYSIVARGYKSFKWGGTYPHNSYLHKAAEIGLFGLAAFLFVLYAFFRLGLHYFNQRKDYLILGFLSGILAFLCQAFFDTHLYSLQFAVLFWYMLGLTIAVIKIETSQNQNSGG